MAEVIVVPRNFRLLEELEKGEKADAAAYSYGLSDRDDLYMYNWDATITVPPAGTAFEGRILTLSIHCGDNYPNVAPVVTFKSKVNMNCVGAKGEVKIGILANWKHAYSIQTILEELLKEMASPANRNTKQPPEGASY